MITQEHVHILTRPYTVDEVERRLLGLIALDLGSSRILGQLLEIR